LPRLAAGLDLFVDQGQGTRKGGRRKGRLTRRIAPVGIRQYFEGRDAVAVAGDDIRSVGHVLGVPFRAADVAVGQASFQDAVEGQLGGGEGFDDAIVGSLPAAIVGGAPRAEGEGNTNGAEGAVR